MICPYNEFKECNWEDCAARMYVQSAADSRKLLKVCAIAYNGGAVPDRKIFMLPEQKEVLR